jgi:hypothetical protein
MTQGTLRRWIMYLMLFGHTASIFMAPMLIEQFNDALTVGTTLLPVTAAVMMFIVQFHQENFFGADTDKKLVASDAAILTLVLTIICNLSIIGMIYLYFIGRIATVEALQRGVGLLDTAIMAYLILLLRRLFERQHQ